ncbi:MAG TPA: hypothetical protein VIA18_29250, partial [Polyangia bacterium]|nr:hypothetical protein [Polyangia bacterium]
MRKLIVLIVVALGAASCGDVDPCAGHSGVCIGLRVEGDVPNLALLDVGLTFGGTTESKPTAVGKLSLPVAVALELPAGTTGDVAIDVLGESAALAVLASGATTVHLTSNHAQAKVTLRSGTGGGLDLSSGGGDFSSVVDTDIGMPNQGSLDMAGCENVTQCTSGDGCCPSGCNETMDTDCPSVCGNHVAEAGEACDDGNNVGGDGCDPTCRWTEKLDRLAGHPGAFGWADAVDPTVARFSLPTAITWDATNTRWYATDSGSCTIRTGTGANPSANVTTLVGDPWNCDASGTPTDGDFTKARFSVMDDIELIGTILYVIDQNETVLRKIDLTNKVVTTVPLPSATSHTDGLGQLGGKLIFFNYDSSITTNNGLYTYDGTTMALFSGGLLSTNVASEPSLCRDITCPNGSTICYLACGFNVVYYDTGKKAGQNFAGAYVAGTGKYSSGCTTAGIANTSALFTLLSHIAYDDFTGRLVVTDQGCQDVLRIDTVGTSQQVVPLAGGEGPSASGFANDIGAKALFNTPLGVTATSSGQPYLVADSQNGDIRAVGAGVVTETSAGGVHDYSPITFSTTPVVDPHFDYTFTGIASDGNYVYALSAGDILKISQATGATTLILPAASQPVPDDYVDLTIAGNTLYEVTSSGRIISFGTDGSNPVVFANNAGTTTPSDGTRLGAGMQP